MQNKTTQKIIIDATKLKTLLRLGCPERVIVDKILYGKFTSQNDDLIDLLLSSLTDEKTFSNWGGSRENAGRKPNKNNNINQDEIKLIKSSCFNQVVDKDKDIDIDSYRENLKINKEFLIDYDSFKERWNRSASRHENMIAINLMTDDRKKKLDARFKDMKKNGQEPTIENFFKIIGTAYQNSEFLQGEKTGFNFTLDFVLQAKSFQKLLENGYK